MDRPDGVWFLKTISLRYINFAYLDTDQNLADDLFVKHKVQVKILSCYGKPGEKYKIVFAKIRKRDLEKTMNALNELSDKALICGYPKYIDTYRCLDRIFRENLEQKNMKN